MPGKALVTKITVQKLAPFLDLEPVSVVLFFAALSFLVYKTVLRNLSIERHRLFGELFRNLTGHLLVFMSLYLGYNLLVGLTSPEDSVHRAVPYYGLLTIAWFAIVFIKTARIFAFEYLFFTHQKQGVPLLLVNILSLILAFAIGLYIATNIFDIDFTPVLATSAVFSLVLGLALQDTLGNLLAAVALQIDKPFEIGEWIEVNSSGQKWVGQITEISWRATHLLGWADETIIIPNRVMAGAQISNWATKDRPVIKSHIFRFPLGSSMEKIRASLLRALKGVPQVRREPPPIVLLVDTTESWLAVRLVYYIDDYGTQFTVGDRVLAQCLHELKADKISLAGNRLHVLDER